MWDEEETPRGQRSTIYTCIAHYAEIPEVVYKANGRCILS
jgi:hypothetical protein